MPSYTFQISLRNMGSVRSEARRLNLAKELVNKNCLSTAQVVELCAALDQDIDRLVIAEKAFAKTIDPDNYYDVYDTFTKFSMVFRLHDYVVAIREGRTPPNNQPPIGGGSGGGAGSSSEDFPKWHYPDASNYQGAKQCDNPSDDRAFMYKYDIVKRENTDYVKLREAKRLVERHCLTVAHLMKLSHLLDSDSYKLQLYKHAIEYIYDPEHYYIAEQAFNSAHYKRQLRDLYEHYRPARPGNTGRVGNGGRSTGGTR